MILNSNDILTAGESYTFTYASGKLFNPSEQSVLDGLRPLMVNFGDVTGVSRGLFSGRYAITVVPSYDYYLHDWLGGFTYSFNAMGWSDASFVQAEGGTTSTKAGGVSQVVSDTAGAVASTASNTLLAVLKPLAPYILVGAAILLAVEYMRSRK